MDGTKARRHSSKKQGREKTPGPEGFGCIHRVGQDKALWVLCGRQTHDQHRTSQHRTHRRHGRFRRPTRT
ncbi:hypothetical protein B0H16DRAFT_1690088 [Mycena metata]|uniref:Uncharacterized protein n=1 Tax=Mycena metata TaxID=1033252 RepID=A0AAD7NDA6_9AGAR|nr:hypothetical protein B0H16DRAFT_1690088 [Mycena metata]